MIPVAAMAAFAVEEWGPVAAGIAAGLSLLVPAAALAAARSRHRGGHRRPGGRR